MDPVTASIIGGGLALNATLPSLFNALGARQQAKFQERMSGSAHQREVKDLLKAGLNPILSANKGATTPAGASTSFQQPNQNMMQNLATATQLKNQTDITRATVQRERSVSDLNRAQARLSHANVGKVIAEIQNVDQTTRTSASQERINDVIRELKQSEKLNTDERTALVMIQKTLAGLQINEQKSMSDLYEFIGSYGKGGEKVMPLLLKILGLMFRKPSYPVLNIK